MVKLKCKVFMYIFELSISKDDFLIHRKTSYCDDVILVVVRFDGDEGYGGVSMRW